MNNLAWWNEPVDRVLDSLHSGRQGLSSDAAREGWRTGQPATLDSGIATGWKLLLAQFRSPTILILIAAAVLSLFLQDEADAAIILFIVFASMLLGFWQERRAAKTVAKLLDLVKTECTVLRDGREQTVFSDDVVRGDIVKLSAGTSVPGDCLLLEAKDLHLDEATLTGETFPVEKRPGRVTAQAPLAERSNALFRGTHVVSGTGQGVVVKVGRDTEFGRIVNQLQLRPPETEFERGIRRFGYFLMEVTLLLVVGIFAINVYQKEPVLQSFMFALALAVGLTPQLLPAIIMVNLSHGASQMARKNVIVRKLASIENFGSMDILCCDKTGTLTEGTIRLQSAVDPFGQPSDLVGQLAYLNAYYETGFSNPIDDAIRACPPDNLPPSTKLDEVPYDFLRKRLSILVEMQGKHLLITKGALLNVLDACAEVEFSDGTRTTIDQARADIDRGFREFSQQGFRTLGIAYRDLGVCQVVDRDSETQLVFAGFLVLHDPAKADSAEIIRALGRLGVSLKMITGDNRWVATTVARSVGMSADAVVTGSDVDQMSDTALAKQAAGIQVFAEVDPNEKERIILALQKSGHVVGFLGDGINDATALHVADVGISVDSAVDVAKEAADIVLLHHDLGVLADGIVAGRQTFANTVKYVFMATSANFGNMFSMAGASLFLPYLPLLPQQILLTNLLTDLSAMTICTDQVDPEDVSSPRRWDIRFIRNFMLVFGALSSVFDYVTFAILLWLLHSDMIAFRTGWFVESVCSATLIVLVVRTRLPFTRSRPSNPLLWASLAVVAITLLLPISPIAELLGFSPQPIMFIVALLAILVAYMGTAELTKHIFYRSVRNG